MIGIIRVSALAALLLSSAAAQAATYDFSYTFADGYAVTGSFDGVANGNLVTDLKNISVFTDYGPFIKNGELYSLSQTAEGGSYSSAPGVASFDGLQNNFVFVDSYFVPGGDGSFANAFQITQFNGTTAGLAQVYPNNGDFHGNLAGAAYTWSLRAVSAVPEPATYAMLFAGLGLIGFSARRRGITPHSSLG